MAVIKFGSIVTSGRGSLGGSTLQPCHSGHIWRNKPTPTKSRTQAQSLIRSYNKAMQAGWKDLSDQDRLIWNNYAKEKPVFNRTGEKHPLSGHSLWMKYQFDALQKGAPFMSDPSEYPGPYFGTELVKNGGFDDLSHWIPTPPWIISGGKAHYDASDSNVIKQISSLKANHFYNLRFDISNCPGLTALIFYDHSFFDFIWKPPYRLYFYLSNGSYSFNAESSLNTGFLGLIGYTIKDIFSIDNLSIREIFS